MKLLLIVTLAHLLVIGAIFFVHPPKTHVIPRRPITVQTIVLQEQKTKEQTVAQVMQQPTPKPTPNPQTAKPQTTKQQVAKPQATKSQTKKTTPKPVVKKQTPKTDPNRSQLISMMQESLQTLDTSSAPTQPTTAVKQIGTLSSEALTFQTNYQEELILYLQTLLTLPEKGDVKLKLTLKRNGSVETIHILNTTSERNSHYVESTLASLSLPTFGSQFKGESTHTFTLTLTSLTP